MGKSRFTDRNSLLIFFDLKCGEITALFIFCLAIAYPQTLFFLNVVTNAQQNLQPPMASEEDVWKAQMHAQKKPHFGPVDFGEIPIYNQERAVVEQMTACSLIGSPESVEFQLKQLRERVYFDEIMAVSYIFDEQKQAQSYTMLKAIVDK